MDKTAVHVKRVLQKAVDLTGEGRVPCSVCGFRYYSPMLSVLDEPAFRQRVSRLSLQEYHQLGEYNGNGKRTELIRGFVIEKMSKSPLHGTIASMLQELLILRVSAGFFVRREEPLTLRDSEPEPDLAVVRGQRSDYLEAHPTTAALVIEVAVSSPDADRALGEIYAEAGVEEYWSFFRKSA